MLVRAHLQKVVIRVSDVQNDKTELVDGALKSDEDARTFLNHLLGEIGSASRRADVMQARRDDAIKKLHDEYDSGIKEQRDLVATLQKTLVEVSETWGIRLYKAPTTTIYLDNGEIAYNRGSEKLDFGEGGEKAFIYRARRLRLYKRLVNIKVTESPNRDAIKKDRNILKKFPGVRFVREPRWEIKPGRVKGTTLTAPAALRSVD